MPRRKISYYIVEAKMGFDTLGAWLRRRFVTGNWSWRRRWMHFLWLCTLSTGVNAEAISLQAVPVQSLGMYADVLKEPAQPLTLAQVRDLQQSGAFRSGAGPVLSFGIGSRPVWVRLVLDNPMQQALPFRLVVGTTWIDHLDVHIVHNDRVTSWQTGDSYPHAQGLTPAEGFVFSPVFEPGRSELYLRAQTDDPLALPIHLVPVGAGAAENALHYGYGFLYGFLIALAVYNTVLYLGVRKRGHLYYALYLISFILLNLSYTGHGYDWWWSAAPGLQRYVILVMMVVCSCVGLLFAGRILSLARHAPRTLRWINGFSLTGLGLLAMCLALDSQYGAALLAFSFITVFTVLMVVLGAMMVGRRQAVGRYFLAATCSGMVGIVMTDLAVWGWIPFNPVNYHAVEIGFLLESTLFSLALAAQMRQIDAARQSAEQLARIDTLTGLHNRRAFVDLALPALSSAERKGRLSSLIMLDVDHFKRINDQHGHGVGDYVLVEVARLLRQICRAGDMLARWGGEEFVVLLPETSLEQAAVLAERIRQQLAALRVPVRNAHIAFTASMGVAEHVSKSSLEALIDEADTRLYAAKKAGRDQVCAQAVCQPA